MSAAKKIDIAGVGKRFATDSPTTPPVLGGITLTIAENEFVVLLGRSGCGKTTLLNIIAGLEHASSGAVRVDETVVTQPGGGKGFDAPRRRIAVEAKKKAPMARATGAYCLEARCFSLRCRVRLRCRPSGPW